MAKSFAAGGHLLFRTQPSTIFSLYPALISPAWHASSMHTTYVVAKSINVVAMTAAALPFYFWARRLAGGWYAVLGTVLFLALPAFVYTGVLMTENAALPLFLLSFFLIALVLERPTLLLQMLVLLAIGLAYSVRAQAVVLVLVLLAGIPLKLGLDAAGGAVERSRRAVWLELRRYWLVFGLLVAGAVAYLLLKAAEGQSLTSGLRAYAGTVTTHYSIRDVLRWSVYRAGELVLAVGVIPACAFVVLLGLFGRRWQATAAERAYLAVTLAALPLILVQVAAYASHYSLRIEERNMLYLEPLLLLALVVWLARGLPRPPGLVSAGVAVSVGLLITIPFESLFNVSAEGDTFGLVPFIRLSEVLNGGVSKTRTLIGIGAICAAILFAVVPRTVAVWGVPATVAAFLDGLVGQRLREGDLHREQRAARRWARRRPELDRPRRRARRARPVPLHDRHRRQPAHPLAGGVLEPECAGRVYGVTSHDPSIPDVNAPLDAATGRIKPGPARGLTRCEPALRRRCVQCRRRRQADRAGRLPLALPRDAAARALFPPHRRPARCLDRRDGGLHAFQYSRLAPAECPHLAAAALRPSAGACHRHGRRGARRPAWETERWTLQNGRRHLFALRLRPGPFHVHLAADPTFVPSQYGLADTRTLGVRVSFSLP